MYPVRAAAIPARQNSPLIVVPMFRHHARGLLLFVPIWNPQGEFGRGRAAGKMLAKGTAGYDGMTKRVPLPEAMRRQMDKMPLETPLKQAASRPCHGQAAQHRTNRISRGG